MKYDFNQLKEKIEILNDTKNKLQILNLKI